MKLIIREYLASLKEREELDAILPDLLSQLGLTVFSRPGRGTTQEGVDVGAYGSLNGDEEKVYLLSIKDGDLTRSTWNGNSEQALRPSLDDILDAYIPTRLPAEYRDKPIVICLCFGGNIKEQVRPKVKGFIDKHTTDRISFEEWHGDKLTELILDGFLREELMPEEIRSLLRKSLALLDEPEASLNHFYSLLNKISNREFKKEADRLTAIRQINICLWILYSWCREQDNLESAYLSSERAMLFSWELFKPYIDKKDKIGKQFQHAIDSMYAVYQEITTNFTAGKIIPNIDAVHGLSYSVDASSKVDVNLKMFDIIGRVAMSAVWTYWFIQRCPEEDEKQLQALNQQYAIFCLAIKRIISHNPILFSPFKDEQAIDISLAVWILALNSDNDPDILEWLTAMLNQIRFHYGIHGNYPTNIDEYYKLIEHPREKTDDYRKEITAGSILYPMISLIAALLKSDKLYAAVKDFKEKALSHCTFQFLYPDAVSEDYYYIFKENHGVVLIDVPVTQSANEMLEEVFNECEETTYFDDLSAVKHGVWPIIMLASRHYRLPVPIHFYKMLGRHKPSSPPTRTDKVII